MRYTPVLIGLLVTLEGDAKPRAMPVRDEFERPGAASLPVFALLDSPVGGARAPVVPDTLPRTGASVAALKTGALLIDPDSGELVRVDGDRKVTQRLTIGAGAAMLVVSHDETRAFVADRLGDRVAVVNLGDKAMKIVESLHVVREPYGLALAANGKTLLVTSVVDGSVTALDTATGKKRWAVDVGAEPRGVTISPDGDEALVASLATGAAARLELFDEGEPAVEFVPLDPPDGEPSMASGFRQPRTIIDLPSAAPSSGRSFARNAFAALHLGNGVAAIAHQTSTPFVGGIPGQEQRGTYGGSSFQSPIEQRVAFLGGDRVAMASTNLSQPRALAWDAARDVLYVAGYGSDMVLAIDEVSQRSARFAFVVAVTEPAARCAPAGLAVDDAGDVLVHCELSRKLARIDVKKAREQAASSEFSAELTKSRLSDGERAGRELFVSANAALSMGGVMACASCHPEGRADGLSWRIEGHSLQTPLLAGGRVEGTHPFKWDGGDKTITASITNTVRRLGGTGVSEEQAKSIAAFLATLPRPRAPQGDKDAVARGRKIFQSDKAGCATCHTGKKLTDGKSYDLAEDLGKVDTPSLIGLASSAPYFHDGSAATLRAVVLENGTVHGMGKTGHLAQKDVNDLVTYLRTL